MVQKFSLDSTVMTKPSMSTEFFRNLKFFLRCVNTEGTYECECADGYRGRGFGGNGCKDIDECHEGNHDCDSYANCINVPGTFDCECVGSDLIIEFLLIVYAS